MSTEPIRNHFYRISVKALILNETRDKFLIVKEDSGEWELPGGGLDWGTTPQEDLPREIKEEMGLATTWIADNPSYFFTTQNRPKTIWIANILYETRLESLDFTPSEECTEVRFVNKDDIAELPTFPNIKILAEQFDPELHRR